MDIDNLATESDVEQAQVLFLSQRSNIYAPYLNKKLTWIINIFGFPLAATLCTIHISLMVYCIPKADYFYEVSFEYSSIGIISFLLFLIGAIISIRNVNKASYFKFWLNLLVQCSSIAVNVGLIIYAISICADVDRRPKEGAWKVTLLLVMIGCAGLQSFCSFLHVAMVIRALICVGDIYDNASKFTNQTMESHKKNAYDEWLPTKFINTLGWIQLGMAMLSFLVSNTFTNCYSYRGGWNLYQFCAVGSYVLWNFVKTMDKEWTYCRLIGLGFLHFVNFACMTGVVLKSAQMYEAVLLPFAAIEMLISGILVMVSIRPIFKVGKLLVEVQR